MKQAIELARLHRARTLLIEDCGSGSQLIQTLDAREERGVPGPIPRRPDTDKEARAHGVSSMVEAGNLYLPVEAHWLGEFKAELLGFPSAQHDDQVDALTQLLGWVRDRWQPRSNILDPDCGPELVTEDSDWSDDTSLDGDDDP